MVTRDARREAARTEYAERLRAALAELETLRLYFPKQGGEQGYSYRLRTQEYSMFVAYRPEDYDARVSRAGVCQGEARQLDNLSLEV